MIGSITRLYSNELLRLISIVLVASLISGFYYLSRLSEAITEYERSSQIYELSLASAIDQYEYLPSLLAGNAMVTEALQSSVSSVYSWDKLNKLLKFSARESGASNAYILDVNGTVIASSNYDEPNTFLGHNYGYRPYFKLAMKLNTKQFYYAIGATTGIPGFFISTPVSVNGKPIGVTVVKLDLRHWEESWRASEQDVIIADKNGIIILSAKDNWRYRFVGKISDQAVQEIRKQRQFGDHGHTQIYSKSFSLNSFGMPGLSFWIVGGQLYIVDSVLLDDTGWTLYYLVDHLKILQPSAIVFLLSCMVVFLIYLYIGERVQKQQSKEVARAIDARRRLELQTIIDNIHIGVISVSRQGAILSFNQFAKSLLLGEVSEVSPVEDLRLENLVDLRGTSKDFDQFLRQEGTRAPLYYETNALVDGKPTTPIMFAVSKVVISDQEVYLMTLVNIEKRKRAENELRQMNENLEELVQIRTRELSMAQEEVIRQGKIAALGQMAAGVVHELSQPLTALGSSVAAVKVKAERNDWQGALESINRLSPLGEKMQNVIRLLKSFSFQDSGQKKAVYLRDVVTNVVNVYADKLHEIGVNIVMSRTEGGMTVTADPLKLDLVFTNIIQNAIDATENSKEKLIIVQFGSTEQYHWVAIEDTGMGVDSTAMSEMFTPYFSTKGMGKGLGLGLSISYEIIQAYGGDIVAENTSSGARFIVKMPVAVGQRVIGRL